MLSPLLRRYTWNSIWLYNVRIFIALCGTVALPWWLNDIKLTIPLTLGVVAGALALRSLPAGLFCLAALGSAMPLSPLVPC